MSDVNLKDLISFCKRRGFVFPCSEIYGGLANSYDYGPYGVELLNNIKHLWWRDFVHRRENIVGVDSSILLHPQTWRSSGHVESFNDPLCDCRHCKHRLRFDNYAQDFFGVNCNEMTIKQMQELFLDYEKQNKIICPNCERSNTLTKPRIFNLMFSTQNDAVTSSDAVSKDKSMLYLRPETAQGIFLNFKNIVDTCRMQVPFGIAQMGKSFRNEIIARQFIFRTREFEQLEIEFFCRPKTQKHWFAYWQEQFNNWFIDIGISAQKLKAHQHSEAERSFYSEDTVDILYEYPFGFSELFGLASRTDYDLGVHQKKSKKNLTYYDSETKERYLPYVIEPSLGLNRLFLAVLASALDVSNENRTLLKLHSNLAPVQIGVFPLQRKPELLDIANKIFTEVKQNFRTELDTVGSIGKRYYRQDELGTPFCLTVDFESLKDQSVTIRFRDSMQQERISMPQLNEYLGAKLS